MKRRHFFLLMALIVLVVILVVVAARQWCHSSPEVSDLYLRYADSEGVEASYVAGFRVNDTLTIDATVLRADDSAAWQGLMDDFCLTKLVGDNAEGNPSPILFRKVRKADPSQTVTVPDEPALILAALLGRHEIHLYAVQDREQCEALLFHLIIEMSSINNKLR